VTIIVSQIKSLLGLRIANTSADDLIGTLKQLAAELPNTKGYDFLMGEVAILTLLLLRVRALFSVDVLFESLNRL
jgi:MFS superfamily sulfate permease-like transporter